MFLYGERPVRNEGPRWSRVVHVVHVVQGGPSGPGGPVDQFRGSFTKEVFYAIGAMQQTMDGNWRLSLELQ